MGASYVDATTRRGAGSRTEPVVARVPALTILLHPEPARVGEVALLEPGARLSRLEPEFFRPGSAGGEPLADPHISRRPVRIAPASDGSVTLVAAEDGSQIVLDGRPLAGERTLAAADVERGVTVELADRVVLLLHTRRPPAPAAGRHDLAGDSDAIEEVRRQLDRVAALDVPVLLQGETGTGKELCARALHRASARAGGPFVAVNAAAIPASVAASELFGHARGAFTGAERARVGHFADSDGGTLFLDEIGEITPEVQAALLRAIEEGAVRPLGAERPISIDVRLVTATDADLDRAVDEGRFKAPLLHRLAGYRIALPPLRARRDDVGRLLVEFLGRELQAAGEPDRLTPRSVDDPPWLPASLVAAFARYRWPGNVRELLNLARHIVVASRGEPHLCADDFVREVLTGPRERGAPEPAHKGRSPARARTVDIGEEELLTALREERWRPGAAAAALGISRTKLYALMDGSPGIRKARDLGAVELRAACERAGGDLAAVAEELQVSERGLKLRLKELGIDLG